MRLGYRVRKTLTKSRHGFTLTEMLVTLLIMTLASTLLATGIPVAIDTYQKTVNSANAQMALSTTLTVLRSEFGASSDIRDFNGDGVLDYRSDEGVYATVRNPTTSDNCRGLVKEYLVDSEEDGAVTYPLVSDAAITEPLHVELYPTEKYEKPISRQGNKIVIAGLRVVDEATPPNKLAYLEEYWISAPFAGDE